MARSSYYGFAPYVSVAEKRQRAQKAIERLKKKGLAVHPVEAFSGRLATSFWGRSWCGNLKSYSDYENRLPRGVSYLRHGCVVDLAIDCGEVKAMVSGTSLYNVTVIIDPLSEERKRLLQELCRGKISSQLDLLQGRIPRDVMELVGDPKNGIIPFPNEIHPRCSCPDSAHLCKHICATLYAVGRRLDEEPETLFTLRGLAPDFLVSSAVEINLDADGGEENVEGVNLGEVLGIDLDLGTADAPPANAATPRSQEKDAAEPSVKVAAKPGGQTATAARAATARPKEKGAAKSPVKAAAKPDGQTTASTRATMNQKTEKSTAETAAAATAKTVSQATASEKKTRVVVTIEECGTAINETLRLWKAVKKVVEEEEDVSAMDGSGAASSDRPDAADTASETGSASRAASAGVKMEAQTGTPAEAKTDESVRDKATVKAGTSVETSGGAKTDASAQPGTEASSGTVAEAKGGAKIDMSARTRTEVQAGTSAETKVEAKIDATARTVVTVKADAPASPQTETRAGSSAQTRAAAKVDDAPAASQAASGTETSVHPGAQVKAGASAEAKAGAKTDVVTQAVVTEKGDAPAAPQTETRAGSSARTRAAAKADAPAAPRPAARSKTSVHSGAQVKAATSAEAKAGEKTDATAQQKAAARTQKPADAGAAGDMKPPFSAEHPTGPDLKRLLELSGMSEYRFASTLGVLEVTAQRWLLEPGPLKIRKKSLDAILKLQKKVMTNLAKKA